MIKKMQSFFSGRMTYSLIILAFYLVVMLAMTLSGTYSGYTSSAEGGDTCVVAKFAFSDDLDTQVQNLMLEASNIYPGKSVTVNAQIQNNSDVTIRYTVKVKNMTKNLPIDDATLGGDVLMPGQSKMLPLVFTWPAENNSADYAEKMDVFRIFVSVEQVN